MEENRNPLRATALPEISWTKSGGNVFIDPEADELSRFQVYRYCSLTEAVQMLRLRQWTFSHPTTWRDRFESHISGELFGEASPFSGMAAYVKCMSVEFASDAV